MSQQKVADMTKAVNVFTKRLLWAITEGHAVDQEELDALNEMRANAGMKPLNIAIPSQQSGPEKKTPPSAAPNFQYQTPRSESEGKPPRSSKKPPKTTEDTDYNPQAIVLNGKQFEGQLLPEGRNWTNRFYIKSESSGRLYTIAQNKNGRFWGCDCPGWIGHRKCKHLTALGLPHYEKPFEVQLKSASTKAVTTIKFADMDYPPLAYVLAAELIHSDAELSQMMEPMVPEVQGEAHIDGPEAGPSNDELHENSHEESGVPVTDGSIKSPERQNVNAIREALETQVEMEVGKPIEQKQQEVAMQEKVQDAALAQGANSLAGGAGVKEVSAKPGTQIIINVGSKAAMQKTAYVKHCPGHKNSRGESAEWCIYSHETGKIISSEKSEGAAKKQLQNMHAHSGAVEAESIGGEDKGKITSGMGTGSFGGTDLEGPSFKTPFHVGFTFRGVQREASFSSLSEAKKFVKDASAKFGKTAGNWTLKAAVDPAKRNLIIELLGHGRALSTEEIEKSLGGGKYTNIAWPVLQELAKEGLLKHNRMRWSLKASVKTAEWKGWTEDMPVEVCGDRSYEKFPNLAAAKQKYPTLDPEHNTKDFTWAMAGRIDDMPAIRFETWPAYKMYSASVKKAFRPFLTPEFTIELRIEGDNRIDAMKAITNRLTEISNDLRKKDPQGHLDSFEQQLPRFMTDTAAALGLQMDYTPEGNTYLFYDQAEEGAPEEQFEQVSSLKSATIRITSTKSVPERGTPEWHQFQIAVQTMKMPDAIIGVAGGPNREESEAILAQYGMRWDEKAYLAGGKGLKQAGDGMAKTETELEKEAGFNFFFPGQVVKEFYPEIQHEIVDYPNASNQPMSGAGSPEIVGDGGHELEGVLDEALDTNIIEMIQLPADVGEVEPLAMAAADYSSTKPAGGMGIGRDGKPEVLEGAPLRKENDVRGYMFTDEFYGQYEGIPGAAMAVASKTAAAGDEAKQFALFLKKVCGEIAATLVAAFKVTARPLLDKIPGMGELQLDTIEQGSGTQMPLGQITQGGRVKWLMDKLNDGEIKAAINEAWAQAAVWNDNPDGGFVYEVFVRPETIDTDSLIMKYKFVCGTKEGQ